MRRNIVMRNASFSLVLALFMFFLVPSSSEGRGGGRGNNRGGDVSASMFSETLIIPGTPELRVQISRASDQSDIVLFLFMGCKTRAPNQVSFFQEISSRANRNGINTVIWNSAEPRGQVDHCSERVSLNDRVSDAVRVRAFLAKEGIGKRFAGIGESQGANVLAKLTSKNGWHSFIALMPHCRHHEIGRQARMIAFAGDKDDAAPGMACTLKWKNAEVHRHPDAYHGWMYPRHIGGGIFTGPDGNSSKQLYNADFASRLSARIDQWFVELRK